MSMSAVNLNPYGYGQPVLQRPTPSSAMANSQAAALNNSVATPPNTFPKVGKRVMRPEDFEMIAPGIMEDIRDPRYWSVAATEALQNFSATDKAMAVPFIRIRKMKGSPYQRTNEFEDGPPLSDAFYESPTFGSQKTKFGEDIAYTERPMASINSVSVKKHNPSGWMLFREIDIDITIHRPDVIVVVDPSGSDQNVVSSLLQPGFSFFIEYGWQGGRNSNVLGLGDYRDEDKAAELSLAVGDPIVRPPNWAVQSMKFMVSHYSFSMTPGGAMKLQVHGIEDGELNIRNTTIFDQWLPPPPDPNDTVAVEQAKKEMEEKFQQLADSFNTELSGSSSDVEIVVSQKSEDTEEVKGTFRMITFGDAVNILFAKPMKEAIEKMAYTDVRLELGIFNKYAPRTSTALGVQSVAGQSIGNLWLKLKDVQDLVNRLVATGQSITVQNCLAQLLSMIQDGGNWSPASDTPNQTVMRPELMVYTDFRPTSGLAIIRIIDRLRYITLLKSMVNNNLLSPETDYAAWISAIRKNLPVFLSANKMAKWNLHHRNNFIKDSKFEITLDEQSKSLFIREAVQENRHNISQQSRADGGLPMGLLIFRSAIQGSITIIGTSAFDLMGQVWIDFGVPTMDGVFFITGMSDKIDKGGFVTELQLRSEGSNPMGVIKKITPHDANSLVMSVCHPVAFDNGLTPPNVPKPGSTSAINESQKGSAYEDRSTYKKEKFLLPVDGNVSSGFGIRQLNGSSELHPGIDIAAPRGTPIHAARAGRVIWRKTQQEQPNSGFGNWCIVEHDGGYTTTYGHCDTLLVNQGDVVAEGQTIATVGNTGKSYGNHLHFEVKKGGVRINPQEFLTKISQGT